MKISAEVVDDPAKWGKLQALNEELTATALRQRGVIFANAMRTVTPPHGKGATMQSTAKKDNEGIRALRKRIAQDIAGVDSPEQIEPFAEPVLTREKKWIAIRPGGGAHVLAKSKGNFGFIVLGSTEYKGKRVLLANPAAVYGEPVFRKGRAHLAGQWAPQFVTAQALRKLVKRQQATAGRFISGWAPGWEAFGGQRMPAGYYKKLGGKGYGRTSGSGAKLQGVIGNDAAPEPAMAAAAAARKRRALQIAAPALKTNQKALMKWYKKKAQEILK